MCAGAWRELKGWCGRGSRTRPQWTSSALISRPRCRQNAASASNSVRDHALPSVSVSDVEVTKDLDLAKVFVTTLLSEESKLAVKALNEMAFEFRRELSRTLKMRRVPEIRFHYDDSVDNGERIEHLLRENAPKES